MQLNSVGNNSKFRIGKKKKEKKRELNVIEDNSINTYGT